MAGITVTVDGLDGLRKALRQVGDRDLQKALMRANKTASEVVVKAALPNVPVRTGRLKASVRALGSQRSGRAVAGAASVPYAAAIHWGRKARGVIQSRPFLHDAAQKHQAEVASVYEREVDDVMDAVRRFTA